MLLVLATIVAILVAVGLVLGRGHNLEAFINLRRRTNLQGDKIDRVHTRFFDRTAGKDPLDIVESYGTSKGDDKMSLGANYINRTHHNYRGQEGYQAFDNTPEQGLTSDRLGATQSTWKFKSEVDGYNMDRGQDNVLAPTMIDGDARNDRATSLLDGPSDYPSQQRKSDASSDSLYFYRYEAPTYEEWRPDSEAGMAFNGLSEAGAGSVNATGGTAIALPRNHRDPGRRHDQLTGGGTMYTPADTLNTLQQNKGDHTNLSNCGEHCTDGPRAAFATGTTGDPISCMASHKEFSKTICQHPTGPAENFADAVAPQNQQHEVSKNRIYDHIFRKINRPDAVEGILDEPQHRGGDEIATLKDATEHGRHLINHVGGLSAEADRVNVSPVTMDWNIKMALEGAATFMTGVANFFGANGYDGSSFKYSNLKGNLAADQCGRIGETDGTSRQAPSRVQDPEWTTGRDVMKIVKDWVSYISGHQTPATDAGQAYLVPPLMHSQIDTEDIDGVHKNRSRIAQPFAATSDKRAHTHYLGASSKKEDYERTHGGDRLIGSVDINRAQLKSNPFDVLQKNVDNLAQ